MINGVIATLGDEVNIGGYVNNDTDGYACDNADVLLQWTRD